MATLTHQTVRQVALIGNPNTGKSTLFGAMVGVRQHVGNYPGVTVEKKTGRLRHERHDFEIIDLPGLYSLAPRSPDEVVAADILLRASERFPTADGVICILDAGNMQRGLYLLSQVLELGLPTVVAVNMLDVAADHGVEVDLDELRRRLPVPVVPIQANRRRGLDELKASLAEAFDRRTPPHETPFPAEFEEEVTRLTFAFANPEHGLHAGPPPRALLRRLLLDVGGYLERSLLDGLPSAPTLRAELAAARSRLNEAGCPIPGVETSARYAWGKEILEGVVTSPDDYPTTVSDRVDQVLTHRLWGTIVFGLLMLIVFQSVFVWAQPLMDLIDTGVGWLAGEATRMMPPGTLRSLIVDGVIAGVGGVVIFLPQIVVLFLFIAVLEDCGYMARAAFLMDRLMARVGLSGKSFIPMLSSFACAVPGIMAARTIENERDRLTTILVAPLLTCSARLPIYALLIAAFVPSTALLGGLLNTQGLVLAGLYVLGIVAAVVAALVLKRTVLRGETPPLLLDLPSYKTPSPRTVVYRVAQRAWHFVRCAGTLILAVSILVWAALYFPQNPAAVVELKQQRAELENRLTASPTTSPPVAAENQELVREMEHLDREIVATRQRHSILGRMGQVIEPVVRPLGWDWRIGCAVIASLPAREVVVATLGVIYNPGDEVDVGSEQGARQLQQRLRSATWEGSDRPVFTLPVALSILVFYALCAQCAATLGVMRQETGSWRWPVLAFTYMTVAAYVGALLTYQGFTRLL